MLVQDCYLHVSPADIQIRQVAELPLRGDYIPGGLTFATGTTVPPAVHACAQDVGSAGTWEVLFVSDGGEDYHRARRYVCNERLSCSIKALKDRSSLT